MSFDKLPENGYSVKVGEYDGEVVKVIKIAGGAEVTVQISDPEDDRPVGGGPHTHLEASTAYYSASTPAEDRLVEEGDKPAEKEDSADNKVEAEKAQAAKPSAASKPVARSSVK